MFKVIFFPKGIDTDAPQQLLYEGDDIFEALNVYEENPVLKGAFITLNVYERGMARTVTSYCQRW